MSTKRGMGFGALFDSLIREEESASAPDWTPCEFPLIASAGITEVRLDFETTGLKWWKGHRPFAAAIEWNGPSGPEARYLSWGHQSDAPRHDEETAKRWLATELKGVHVANAHIKTEIHHAREWGVDLEGIVASVTDVQHHAALLDDHRRVFNQDALCLEFLPDERKVDVVNGVKLDMARAATYAPGLMSVRALADVRQVGRLMKEVFLPRMEAEGLMRVKALEDECLWASCEMEKNGALIDVQKLRFWAVQVRREYEQILQEIHRLTGIKFNPDSGTDWSKLFHARGIVNTEMTQGKRPKQSFTDSILLGVIKATDDPIITLGRKAGRLADLLSKYLDKYAATVEDDGILRFQLHQLRSDEGGTVSGRFAASAIKIGSETIGANIQQVLALEKQLDLYGPDYIIRELFIAAGDKEVVSADAEQIEYRLFADEANNPRILSAYAEDRKMELEARARGESYNRLSFHKLVHEYLKPLAPDLGYKQLKNLNFMKIYGGGLVKLASMMGHITENEAAALNAMKPWDRNRSPLLAKTRQVQAIYDRVLPEASPMLKKYIQQAETRGWIETFSGRRARFPKRMGMDGGSYTAMAHKALNARIQGSAGDVMKQKMIEVHKVRKDIGFTPRMTVHDQLIGDGEKGWTSFALANILDEQSFDLKVPVLWSVANGESWRACDEQK